MDGTSLVFTWKPVKDGEYLLSTTCRKDVVNVMKKMTNFELSETPSFMAHYIAALFLPHTDLDLFPKLKERLERRPKRKPIGIRERVNG